MNTRWLHRASGGAGSWDDPGGAPAVEDGPVIVPGTNPGPAVWMGDDGDDDEDEFFGDDDYEDEDLDDDDELLEDDDEAVEDDDELDEDEDEDEEGL